MVKCVFDLIRMCCSGSRALPPIRTFSSSQRVRLIKPDHLPRRKL